MYSLLFPGIKALNVSCCFLFFYPDSSNAPLFYESGPQSAPLPPIQKFLNPHLNGESAFQWKITERQLNASKTSYITKKKTNLI